MAKNQGSEGDVIVVGAGSAGSVLAARLTEDPAREVIVLEAGPDWAADDLPASLRMMPGESSRTLYLTEPAYYWQGLTSVRHDGDAPQRYLRGRGVGGSSTVNSCHAIRPPLVEFDDWVELGCSGWGPSDVLPYFIKLEEDRDFGHEPYHGREGPLPIKRTKRQTWGSVESAFCDSALGLGHAWQDDHSAPSAEGFSPFALNVLDNRRVTTNDAYLLPARGRSNLRVVPNALVDRVLLSHGRATGVRVRVGGDWLQFYAPTVIISAGSPLSPGVLERSGIGRADALRRLGISAVVNLPVGESMQDHADLKFGLVVSKEEKPSQAASRINNVLRWTSGVADTGFLDLHGCISNAARNDTGTGSWPTFLGTLHQVFSRGRVTVSSPDPEQAPRIDHNLLSDQRDIARMRVIFATVAQLVRQEPLCSLVDAVVNGAGDLIDFSMVDDELDHWIWAEASNTSNMAGTCRMGSPDAETSVVDPHCRVLGVEGLWVIDASVLPIATRANMHLTVLMVAEKAADLIRSEVGG